MGPILRTTLRPLLMVIAAAATLQPLSAQTSPGVTAHRDLEYVADGHERHKLDLYLPAKVDGKVPLIIWCMAVAGRMAARTAVRLCAKGT
ncbi:hypothetical protein [Verrucomicrobium spinosum]|uniref:hypothetical protein n=1 Tax=Verrucomicrobium spinosum TaxID=2736 RepID=UPI000B2B495B|nr:hypothetical protein [Verrucomicrobium spinosum]